MEVFHHQEHGALLEAPLQERPDGSEDLPLELLGLDVGERRVTLEPQDVAEEGGQALRLVRVGPEVLQSGGEFLTSHRERVTRRHPISLADEGGQDPVRVLTEGGAHRAADREGAAVRDDAGEKLADQP